MAVDPSAVNACYNRQGEKERALRTSLLWTLLFCRLCRYSRERAHSNADAEGQAAAEIFHLAFTCLVALPQTPAD